MRLLLALCAFVFSSLSFAQDLPNPLYSDSTPPPKEKSILESESVLPSIGDEKADDLRPGFEASNLFEIRPTLIPLLGEFHTENTLELGLKYNKDTKFSYVQYFNTNLYNPADKKNVFQKSDFKWQDSFLRLKLDKLWESESKDTNFGFQHRIYLPTASSGPTYPSRLDQGMIVILRNYFTGKHRPLSFMEMELSLVPSFFLFKRDGYSTDVKEVANPVYEHYVSGTLNIEFSDSVLLSIPIQFRATKYRNYRDDASLSDRWGYNLSALPELDWTITPMHTVGICFVTNNYMKVDGSGWTDTAYKQGLVQLVWGLNF